MIKLVPPPPQDKARACGNASNRARVLCQQIEDDRALGQATQRVVASGRRIIIEAQCCLQRLLSQCAAHGTLVLRPDDQADRVADFAERLGAIHQRLLLFSSSVELEIDRLDMLGAEVEQLLARPNESEKTS